jgi:hypothetical protein
MKNYTKTYQKLALCVQAELGLTPSKVAEGCYAKLTKYMLYACGAETNFRTLKKEGFNVEEFMLNILPSYSLSEQVRREIINLEMSKDFPNNDKVTSVLVGAEILKNDNFSAEEGGDK